MRRTFQREVRDYVIVERYKGKPWKQIVAGVRERFNIEPPSIRIMQSWFQSYQSSAEDPTGVKMIATAVEETASRAQPLAYAKMMTEMPHIFKIHDKYKIPIEDAGWIVCLSVVEDQVGRERFDKILAQYKKIRNELTYEK